MNKEVGLYMAVAFLGVMALAAGLAFYGQFTQNEYHKKLLKEANVKELIDEYNNQNVKNLKLQVSKEEEAKESTLKRLKITEEARKKAEETAKVQMTLNANFKKLRTQLSDTITAKNKDIAALKERIESLGEKINAPNEQVEQFRKDLQSEKLRSENLNRQVMRQQQARRLEKESAKKQSMQFQSEIDKLRQIIGEYKFVDKKRSQTKTEQTDGKILEVDINRKFGVINLGSVHHVRLGMKFDVIRYRQGKWHNMGTVEITKVMPATSTVTILSKVKNYTICPLCGYIGSSNMRNCPYCRKSGGEDDIMSTKVVPLMTGDVEEGSTMDPLDPIIEGDFITNPLYSRDRVLNFAIAGKPIKKYSTSELKTLIRKYGGKVSDSVGVETDYLILCQIPPQEEATTKELKAEYDAAVNAKKAANQYGIPIMREVDLLNMIDK